MVQEDHVFATRLGQTIALAYQVIVGFHTPIGGASEEIPQMPEIGVTGRGVLRTEHIPRGIGVVVSGVPAGKADLPGATADLFRRLDDLVSRVGHAPRPVFIAELDVDDRPIPLTAVLEGCRVPLDRKSTR